MLILISPAKTLDFETPPGTRKTSDADFLPEAQKLVEELKQLSPAEVSSLMGISDQLGILNAQRFNDWQQPFDLANAKQALLAFKGDVYAGLQAEQFGARDLNFAQKHLRILSGLYGLLRPLDLIQPYRLEMGLPFENQGGRNLYQFWGEKITDSVNGALAQNKGKELINLASNEYFKSVKPGSVNADIITPVFKDLKNERYKVVSFFAKKARGLMSAYAIRNRITRAKDLKDFAEQGYRYSESMSEGNEWVFVRDTVPQAA